MGSIIADSARFLEAPLSKQPVGQEGIQAALLSVGEDVWQYIWNDQPPPYITEFPYTRQETTINNIRKIVECENIDALFALIALARECRNYGMNELYFCLSCDTQELFPRVVGKTPHLYICWRALATRIRTVLWDPTGIKSPNPGLEIDLDEMEIKIEQLARATSKEGISFPSRGILERHNRAIE